MEENITKQKANTIAITLYSNTATDSKTMSEALHDFIDPDGNDAREFVFRTGSFADGLANPAPDTELYILAGNEGDADMDKLVQLLEKKGNEHIVVTGEGEALLDNSKKSLAALEKTLDLGFTVSDFVQMNRLGIPIEKVRKHLITFRNGIGKIVLKRPATLNDGIVDLYASKADELAAYFDTKKDSLKLMKFVPASGAASRMFKFVCEFLADFDAEKETINAYINRRKDEALKVFFVGIDKFPFFNDILKVTKENPEYASLPKDLRYFNFVKTMLTHEAFDYVNKPKGILPFHQYEGFAATPVYEHLKESAAYATSNGVADVHFTISEEHLDGFLDTIEDARKRVEAEYSISINYSFSYQHKQTDTISVDMNNMPFRNEDNSLLFRPGGHGALIQNLNELDADIVFVKNIDNVSHNNIEVIGRYKKALAGQLIQLQEQVFECLKKIEQGNVTEQELKNMFAYAMAKLSIDIPREIMKFTKEHQLEFAKKIFNRPIRICGMVRNEGEPGGGPFWVKDDSGSLSLQIVESSQIDLENPEQAAILAASSHFNPVDLVCGLKNYKGEKFDLEEFIDPSTGFIVYKNKMGKDLKGYELPGLWNGAMAGWITVFTEVPIETFNPVKTVNDLLKPAHQPV
ncbi:DUF4301 domain-containing protein [Flavobacterium album]|uniref:DUF4301 domain-containing protein n=1 Tax=Flavobacterium album TaxID=2175091 RepID=A0A2S1QWH8_9FLAO|nr:DUF4301 family protein [Flavobacterium album]AWH84768.1 DUF4301 domain-containing protein [Flavobacterium album]